MSSLRLYFFINGFFKTFPRVSIRIGSYKSIFSSYVHTINVKNLSTRHIHSSHNARCEKRKLAVSHLALQELAVSALRRLEIEGNKFNRAKKLDIELVLKGCLKELLVKGEESIFLLRCCGALLPNEKLVTRNNLTEAVWMKLCNSGIQLSNDHFIALLETHIENDHYVCPKDFLLEMKRLGVEPNRETLIKLLSCTHPGKSPKDKMDELVLVVQEMKTRGYSANLEMFEALASTLAEAGDLVGAEDIVETMTKLQLEPTAAVYASLIKGYVTLGDESSVLRVLNAIEKRNLSLSASQYVSVVTKLAEITYLSKANDTQSVVNISRIIPLMKVSEDENVLQCVSNGVLELVHKGKEGAALALVLSLPPALLSGHRFLEPLPILFSKEVVRADVHSETIVEICDQLESLAVPLLRIQGFLEPFLLHTVTGLALHLGKKDLSEFLLEALFLHGAKLKPHYFWPVMCIEAKEKCEVKREQGVLKVLKKMIDLGVKPDIDTLAHYTIPFMNSKIRVLDVLTILRKNGVNGTLSRTAITYWLLSKGDLKQAANLNEVHRGKIDPLILVEPLANCLTEGETKSDRSTLSYVVKILNAMSRKGVKWVDYTGLFLVEVSEKLDLGADNGKEVKRQHEAVKLLLAILKFLDEKNLRISPQAEDYLIYIIQPQLDQYEIDEETKFNMPCVDSGLTLPKFQTHIPHPREMSLDELECHLLELRAKGLNERGVLRRLFQLHCQLGNIERALQIKKDIDSGGHSFSPGMLSSLLTLYIRQNMVEKSKEIFHRIKKNYPNFKLDDYKVIDVATLLSKHGQVNDGMELLREHSRTVKVMPGPLTERNLLSLLQAVYNLVDRDFESQTNQETVNSDKGNVNSKSIQWTVSAALNELIKLGYVTNPPPKSIMTWLEKTD